MAITVSKPAGETFEPIPEGTHLAVCNMVVDLGKQRTTYNGEEQIKHQILIRWEVPDVRIEWEDKTGAKREGPRGINRTYTASLHEKSNLRKDLEAWRGRKFTDDELSGFNVVNVLGVSCLITIGHTVKDDRTYANILSVSGLPKGMEKAFPENELVEYNPEEHDQSVWENLAEWIQEKINKRVTEQQSVPAANESILNDEVPF